MNSHSPESTMRTTSLAIVIAAFASASAHADVVTSYWVNTGTFEYRVSHMPDLDQVRTGLSNTGYNHCVPTSTMNLFAYAANHGYPFFAPGPGNWQSNALHPTGTTNIQTLGTTMATSGTNGTNGTGRMAGINWWLANNGLGLISCISKSKSASYTPTVAKMVQLATQGWIMSFAYGRYNVVGTVGGQPSLSRDGGHAVTLQWSRRNSGQYFLRYRDPADETASTTTQSTFVSKEVFPVAYTAHFGGADFRTMNAIAYPSSDGKVRLVDSYWGIRPTFAYRFVNTSNLLPGGGSIHLMDPTPFEGTINQSLPVITVSPLLEIGDLAFHPDMTEALVLTRSVFGGSWLLRRLDLVSGAMTIMTNAPTDIGQVCSSREGFMYAFDLGGKMYRLDPENDGAIDMANSSIPTPSAICFDDSTDTVRLLSVAQRRIMKFSKTLSTIENWTIPTSVPLAGDGSVRVDPTTGLAWFKTSASGLLYNITLAMTGAPVVTTITPVTVPGGLQSFQFGERGELYLLGGTTMRVMKRNPASGQWELDTTSPFHNLPGGARLAMFTSSSNNDPALHDTPAWNNILAPDLLPIGVAHEDCDADFTGDSIVNGADLGYLLARWGTVRGVADLNQDGVVNGADLGVLLSAWGNCP